MSAPWRCLIGNVLFRVLSGLQLLAGVLSVLSFSVLVSSLLFFLGLSAVFVFDVDLFLTSGMHHARPFLAMSCLSIIPIGLFAGLCEVFGYLAEIVDGYVVTS